MSVIFSSYKVNNFGEESKTILGNKIANQTDEVKIIIQLRTKTYYSKLRIYKITIGHILYCGSKA